MFNNSKHKLFTRPISLNNNGVETILMQVNITNAYTTIQIMEDFPDVFNEEDVFFVFCSFFNNDIAQTLATEPSTPPCRVGFYIGKPQCEVCKYQYFCSFQEGVKSEQQA